MRLRGRTLHVAGWTGPLVEDAEPDLVDGLGAVDDGLNWMARDGAKRIIRGGSASVLSLAAVSGQNISDVLGLWPWTPTGAFALAHAVTGSKHYGYALTDTPAFALPVGAATEADSRLDLGWNSATPARPHAVELFEKLYIVDATEATTRQGMLSVSLSGGVLAVSTPTYDLDNSGGSPGALKGFAAEVYNGVLFVSGYDNETAANSGTAPHLLRHSLLGTDPASASGFHPDAYAIIGAKGQWIRALRAGRTSLLVAKEHELYKVYGQGRALGGWQYQIQQVNQTLGVGCTNPYALDHAFGMWYGIGRSGPWRSDGETVELLRAGRDRSWSKVDKLHLAQVRFYPERRQMVFAVYITGQPTYAVAPFEYWTWDMARDQWDVNQRYKRSFHMVNPVVQGATSAPSGIPGVPVQDFTYSANVMGLHNLTTIVWGEFSFNAADLTAETEVWTCTASGTVRQQSAHVCEAAAQTRRLVQRFLWRDADLSAAPGAGLDCGLGRDDRFHPTPVARDGVAGIAGAHPGPHAQHHERRRHVLADVCQRYGRAAHGPRDHGPALGGLPRADGQRGVAQCGAELPDRGRVLRR
jgi:hypothetical protein